MARILLVDDQESIIQVLEEHLLDMGHSTLALTERYSHLGSDTLRRAVRVFEEGVKESKESKEKSTHYDDSEAGV